MKLTFDKADKKQIVKLGDVLVTDLSSYMIIRLQRYYGLLDLNTMSTIGHSSNCMTTVDIMDYATDRLNLKIIRVIPSAKLELSERPFEI